MGRAKIKMELIKKEKSRNLVFKNRKAGLIRKMHEFTILCDVSACMIIYGPKQENGPTELVTWPQNPGPIIDLYEARKPDSQNKTFGLNDFFHGRKKKIEEELSKLRKNNKESKYPTHLDDTMKTWNLGQLRQFAAILGNKAKYVKGKIEILKMQGLMEANNLMHFSNAMMNGQFYPLPPLPIHYHSTTIDQHQQNSLMMIQMNGGDQFGGGANFQSGNQNFYETASSSSARGMVDPMICHDMKPYYAQSLPPLPGYMVAPPQLRLPSGWENSYGSYENIVQYQMENGG